VQAEREAVAAAELKQMRDAHAACRLIGPLQQQVQSTARWKNLPGEPMRYPKAALDPSEAGTVDVRRLFAAPPTRSAGASPPDTMLPRQANDAVLPKHFIVVLMPPAAEMADRFWGAQLMDDVSLDPEPETCTYKYLERFPGEPNKFYLEVREKARTIVMNTVMTDERGDYVAYNLPPRPAVPADNAGPGVDSVWELSPAEADRCASLVSLFTARLAALADARAAAGEEEEEELEEVVAEDVPLGATRRRMRSALVDAAIREGVRGKRTRAPSAARVGGVPATTGDDVPGPSPADGGAGGASDEEDGEDDDPYGFDAWGAALARMEERRMALVRERALFPH
jgi:hypothetical protein